MTTSQGSNIAINHYFGFDNNFMLKINSYFKPLTREQKEHLELTAQQESRARKEIKDNAEEANNSVMEIVHLIHEDEEEKKTLLINSDLQVGDVVRNAFDQMMTNDLEPLVVSTSSTQIPQSTKRKKNEKA